MIPLSAIITNSKKIGCILSFVICSTTAKTQIPQCLRPPPPPPPELTGGISMFVGYQSIHLSISAISEKTRGGGGGGGGSKYYPRGFFFCPRSNSLNFGYV